MSESLIRFTILQMALSAMKVAHARSEESLVTKPLKQPSVACHYVVLHTLD